MASGFSFDQVMSRPTRH